MKLSNDGYVRLQLDTLLSTTLVHLVSGVDTGDCPDAAADGKPTTISGYTEWVSTSKPVITLGWDWHLTPAHDGSWCVRTAAPRSNIMLVDEEMRDIDWRCMQIALAAVVDALSWQQQTQEAIVSRYAWCSETSSPAGVKD